jgi:4-diphosphocytidyl-2-C-methyl-D-erythritol kinase
MMISVLAPAKLNLTLRVLAREASGFHQIETLFCALALADEIEVTLGHDRLTLEVHSPPESAGPPPDLGPLRHNLAWRAAEAFQRLTGQPPQAAIRLTKRIPAGAGLGGGSSDAAAVLRALNTLHHEPLTQDQLLRAGAELGSDVPFFLSGAVLALAWGRGGRLAPLRPLPDRPVVLAVPRQRVDTGAAYAGLAAQYAPAYVAPPAIIETRLQNWAEVAASAENDFEPFVFGELPLLAAVRAALAQSAGAEIARMTGTGSVLFGIFNSDADADAALDDLEATFADVEFIRTRTAAALATGLL